METLITKAIPQDTTMGKLTERMIVKEADNLHERKERVGISFAISFYVVIVCKNFVF